MHAYIAHMTQPCRWCARCIHALTRKSTSSGKHILNINGPALKDQYAHQSLLKSDQAASDSFVTRNNIHYVTRNDIPRAESDTSIQRVAQSLQCFPPTKAVTKLAEILAWPPRLQHRLVLCLQAGLIRTLSDFLGRIRSWLEAVCLWHSIPSLASCSARDAACTSDCKDLLNSTQHSLLAAFSAKQPCKMEHGILLSSLVLQPLTEVVGVHHQLLSAFVCDNLRLQALPHKLDDMNLQSKS